MKTKYKIGDSIITTRGTEGRILDIEERSDGSIWYIICWNNQKIIYNYNNAHIDSGTELNTKLLRNRTLSKILDK